MIEGGTRTAKVRGKNIRVPAEMTYHDYKRVYVDKTLSLKDWQSSRESGKIKIAENERAAIRDNGLKNSYTVNLQLMNSKAYHDKFEGLTGRKKVDEALYRQALKILEHRNGTEYEDIAVIDARTGAVLAENTSASGIYKFKCGLFLWQEKALKQAGRQFELLHNHPGSTEPSTSDVIGLFKRELATASTVAAHDGTIYRMVKLQPFLAIEEFAAQTYNEMKKFYGGYPENLIESKTFTRIIEQLKSLKKIEYQVIK